MSRSSEDVRAVLQQFQDGYTARDVTKLDEFMRLFAPAEDIELIGVGAAKRAANEWFVGQAAIRDIVEGDWTYWGDVTVDVVGAKIIVNGDVAWLTTTGAVTQTQAFDKALPQYLQQMKAILENAAFDSDTQLMEATHFGVRRLRERSKGLGYSWPFTFVAVLVNTDDQWRFHTIHWSMPVD
ncbi:MAG: nuclear transport factor 2 family protein [Anaerolineae bacterium]